MPEMAHIYIWIFSSALQGHQFTEEIKEIWSYPCQKVQTYFSTIFSQNLIFNVTASIKTFSFKILLKIFASFALLKQFFSPPFWKGI